MNLRPALDSWVRERHNKLSTDSDWVTLSREQKANRLKDCILADHDLYGNTAVRGNFSDVTATYSNHTS